MLGKLKNNTKKLIKQIYPYRYRCDIANKIIEKADCEESERIEAKKWLKDFHNSLKVEIIQNI